MSLFEWGTLSPKPPGIYRIPPVWWFLLAFYQGKRTIILLVPEDRATQGCDSSAAPSPVWSAANNRRHLTRDTI